MNLELLDPFRNSFPEIIEETLEEGICTTCAFNRRGTLLCTGCADGRCIIWDFDTKGIAQILTGHIQPVTSVSWSKNGRLLLSSSTDWMVILYDVLEGTIKKKFQFESLVLSAQMHPKLNDFCIVCVFNESPILLNLTTDERKILPETEDIENKLSIDNKKLQKNPTGTIAVFNKQGNKIFIGNWNGVIIAFDMNLLQILYHFKVSTAPIKSIQFSKSGKQFLVNSTDRIIRLYEGEDSKTIAREFQDPVNKVQWKKCCFSCDDDYIIAGSAQKSQHNIYIWNRESGQLIKTLEGPKEAIIDLVWHPNRPIIVSIAQTGAAFIWASNYTENWSAFAPDFKELEENEEYIEKEDEFDIYSEEENNKKRKREENEDVDIISNDKITYYSSESDDDLFFIPITITKDVNIK